MTPIIIITCKFANCDVELSIFRNKTEYKHQEITAANIHKSPEVKYRLYKLFKLPFKIIENAPRRDKIIPANCSLVVFVLKINHEKPIIITGATDAIRVELITIVVLRDM